MKEEISYGIIPLQKRDNNWYVFLVHHRDGNHWGFPKGKPRDGESHQQSAVRELREETNLKVIFFLQEEPLSEAYIYTRNNEKTNKTVHYFLAMVEGTISIQKEEVLEGDFFSFEQAKKTITHAESQKVLAEVLAIVRAL